MKELLEKYPHVKIQQNQPQADTHGLGLKLKVGLFIFIGLVVLQSLDSSNPKSVSSHHNSHHPETCQVSLVESLPEGLEVNKTFESIYSAWKTLIEDAEESIDIGSFYWSMKGSDVIEDPSDWQGESIFNSLRQVGLQKSVKIRIAQSKPSRISPDNNTAELSLLGAAEVRTLDFDRIVGGGVLHTKLWVVDKKHLFVGSANMDWRSLTQVKEVGVLIRDCPALAKDISKIFTVYWKMGAPGAILPGYWPASLSTDINSDTPLPLNYGSNGSVSNVYLSSSPPPFVTSGRTGDLDSILKAINSSTEFIHISVMEYLPLMMFSHPRRYWPLIDDALRSAAVDRKVSIKILVGHWQHSPPEMDIFLKSLTSLSGVYPHVDIQVKHYVVPTVSPSQAKIPFARVNHNKFMVTDFTAYIGTSNWSGDYFVNTAGVGVIFENSGSHQNQLRTELAFLFDRDWNSQYASFI